MSPSRRRNSADTSPKEAPQSVEQALSRAREHSRAAASELLLAMRALLDAAAISLAGSPAASVRGLASLTGILDDFSESLARDPAAIAGPLFGAILDALDEEIARWEARSRDDKDARAVLRAFLGVREILWEFGMRRPGEEAPRKPAGRSAAEEAPQGEPEDREEAAPAGRRRIQRVRVQG